MLFVQLAFLDRNISPIRVCVVLFTAQPQYVIGFWVCQLPNPSLCPLSYPNQMNHIQGRPGSRLRWFKSCLNIIWASMLTKSTLNSITTFESRFFSFCPGSQNEYAKNFTLLGYLFWMDLRWTSMILWFYLESRHANNLPIYTDLVVLDSRVPWK